MDPAVGSLSHLIDLDARRHGLVAARGDRVRQPPNICYRDVVLRGPRSLAEGETKEREVYNSYLLSVTERPGRAVDLAKPLQ
jgi:hypothetical protein